MVFSANWHSSTLAEVKMLATMLSLVKELKKKLKFEFASFNMHKFVSLFPPPNYTLLCWTFWKLSEINSEDS